VVVVRRKIVWFVCDRNRLTLPRWIGREIVGCMYPKRDLSRRKRKEQEETENYV